MNLIMHSTANKREEDNSSTSLRHERRLYGIAALFLLTFLLSLPQAHAKVGEIITDNNIRYSVLTEDDSTGTVSVSRQLPTVSLGDVTIPSSITWNSKSYQVTSIFNMAFREINSLTSIVIPESVTKIGNEAFKRCGSLTSVIIGDGVTSIGNYAFSECSGLTSMIIPDYVISIGIEAFSNCDGLTSVVIPDSVISMGQGVFAGCDSLASVIIGNSVTTIGSSAFSYCGSLTSIVIPDSVTAIEKNTFRECTSLSSVVIGDGVTLIGDYAFNYCSSLATVIIGDSVTSVGYEAFRGCEQLKHMEFPDVFTSIGDYAFYECSSLRALYFNGDAPTLGFGLFSFVPPTFYYLPGKTGWDAITNVPTTECSGWMELDSIFYVYFENKTASVSGYEGSPIEINLPSSINVGSENYPVKSIAMGVFNKCSSLRSIKLPENLISIGEGALSICSNLTSVELPDGLTSIGQSAFQGCSSLPSLVFPESVTSIGGTVFYDCSSLNALFYKGNAPTFGNGAMNVTPWTFYLEGKTGWDAVSGLPPIKCSGWQEIDSVYYVYFNDQTARVGGYRGSPTEINILSSIVVGSETYPVNSMGSAVFKKCSSLTSIEIPDSVTSIGASAFRDCGSLTSVMIGDGVTSIGNYAFNSCTSLASAYFKGDAPTLGTSAFENVPTTIYYLEGTTGWEETYGGRPTAIWSPEPTSFSISVGIDPENPGDLLLTVEAKAGDQFTMEFSGDLGGVWDSSAEEYVASEDGPYAIRIPQTGEHVKFFRLKRTR